MSTSMDEYTEAGDACSLQIGDSVTAYTYPLTEGLIIDRKIAEDGRLNLTLLIAPYKKKGSKWSATRVSLRDAARLSKKPPARFTFPIKGIEKLREEAKRNKSDPVWVATVKASLNKDFQQNALSSESSEQENKDEGDESDDLGKVPELQVKESEVVSEAQRFVDLEKRVGEVLQLHSIKDAAKKKDKQDKEVEDSDFEQWKKWKKDRKRRKRKNKRKRARASSSLSSSSSSSSSSEEELRAEEVGEKGSSGIYVCPFKKTDAMGLKDVKSHVQGQAVTRRKFRLALYNLYGEYHTLTSFTDKFVHQAQGSPYRPFSMDVSWFQAYAEYLDMMLLNSLQGPWVLWNEPVIDQMATGFLELLIRISPYKVYPVCLDDAVRKWMKKKRIGTNSNFGSVSYAMQHGKFTDGGIVLSQTTGQKGWERIQNIPKQGINVNSRPNSFPSTGGDKRPPPPS